MIECSGIRAALIAGNDPGQFTRLAALEETVMPGFIIKRLISFLQGLVNGIVVVTCARSLMGYWSSLFIIMQQRHTQFPQCLSTVVSLIFAGVSCHQGAEDGQGGEGERFGVDHCDSQIGFVDCFVRKSCFETGMNSTGSEPMMRLNQARRTGSLYFYFHGPATPYQRSSELADSEAKGMKISREETPTTTQRMRIHSLLRYRWFCNYLMKIMATWKDGWTVILPLGVIFTTETFQCSKAKVCVAMYWDAC